MAYTHASHLEAGTLMSKTLKQANQPKLYLLLVLNAVVFYSLLKGYDLFSGEWQAVRDQALELIPAALGASIVGLLLGQLTSDQKAALISWNWQHRLPGSQAYTRHGPADPRLDMEALENQLGPFPIDPEEQNRHWYRHVYKPVRHHHVVNDAHANYLFSRDYAWLSLLMLVLFGLLAFWQFDALWLASAYFAGLLLQWLLVVRSARTYGIRFVTNALAEAQDHTEVRRAG